MCPCTALSIREGVRGRNVVQIDRIKIVLSAKLIRVLNSKKRSKSVHFDIYYLNTKYK